MKLKAAFLVSIAIASHIEVDGRSFGVKPSLERHQSKSPSWNRKATHLRNVQPSDSLESHSIFMLRGGGIVSNFADYIGESRSRCWTVLLLSILTDAWSTTMMKWGRDQSSVAKIVTAYCGFFFSLSGLALSLGSIDVSIVYAVWAALGTAIVSIVGITIFGETCNLAKLIGLAMIISGVVIVEAHG